MNVHGHQGKSFTEYELEVIAISSKGMTVRDAAKELNCSTTTIIKARRACGVDSPKCGVKKSKEVQVRREKMQAMLDSGLSVDQVSDEIGVSESYVRKFAVIPKKINSNRFDKTKTAEYISDSKLMQALRDSGETIASIAEKFEVSIGNVSNRTTRPERIMSLTKLKEEPPEHEVKVTLNGKVIGTFIPAKSAH